MPWKTRDAMDEKCRFVLECEEPGANISELCREYGIARSTGTKILKRYKEEGFRGLEERSRKPNNSPLSTSPEIVCEIVKYREKHKNRGAEKIRYRLVKKYGESAPSVRTINRILERCGLLEKRQKPYRGKSVAFENSTRAIAEKSNDIWTADYKGHWQTKDKIRCEPLTIRDDYSRYLLDVAAFEYIRLEAAKERFRRCFELYGLPLLIRTDNGVPFATKAICGLSKLAVWWIKLGIQLERIPKGRPQFNGGHERMHRDIALELEANPAKDLQSQQKAINLWCYDFNYERPHSALKNKTPADFYKPSQRKYDSKEPEYEYPDTFELRKVDSRGYVYWKNIKRKISKALSGEYIAFEQADEMEANIWFCDLLIAKTDLKNRLPLTPIGVNLEGRAINL